METTCLLYSTGPPKKPKQPLLNWFRDSLLPGIRL